ncbi:hypothetical protein Gpo141_00010573, partial [Globisporangium polare]
MSTCPQRAATYSGVLPVASLSRTKTPLRIIDHSASTSPLSMTRITAPESLNPVDGRALAFCSRFAKCFRRHVRHELRERIKLKKVTLSQLWRLLYRLIVLVAAVGYV